MTPPASVEDFKGRFVREFVFGATPDMVMDADVSVALTQASMVFNPGLWDDAASAKEAFLLASAHFVELNVQAAGGLSGVNLGKSVRSTGGGVIQNKSVGSVSIAYAIPERVQNSPILSPFMKTDHGQLYLQILAPRLVGNMMVAGRFGCGDGAAPTMYVPPVPPPDDH